MALLYWDTPDDHQFIFGETLRGRALAAARRVATSTLGGALILGLLFLPDYLGRYRQQEPWPGAAWLAVLGVAVAIGLLLGLMRVTMREVWILDAASEQLIIERATLGRSPTQEGLDLADLRALRFTGDGATLELVFRGGETTTIAASGRLGHADLLALADALQAWAPAHLPGLEIERAT